jgi:hypothetical protein
LRVGAVQDKIIFAVACEIADPDVLDLPTFTDRDPNERFDLIVTRKGKTATSVPFFPVENRTDKVGVVVCGIGSCV